MTFSADYWKTRVKFTDRAAISWIIALSGWRELMHAMVVYGAQTAEKITTRKKRTSMSNLIGLLCY